MHAYTGCCWAFSAVAAIEGIAAIRTGQLTPISEQNILDCNSHREGCAGGYMIDAFEFVRQNGGVASDADYPYQTMQGACAAQIPSSLSVEITGFAVVPPNDEAALLAAVTAQPVSVGLDPMLLQFYRSGVLTGECGKNRSHAITAVGYGTSDDGIKFWLFKNSWGSDWGEEGFVRLQRDIVDEEGMCGIAMDASYPTA